MKKDNTNISITISEEDKGEGTKLSKEERKHLEEKLKVLMDKWTKLDLEQTAKEWNYALQIRLANLEIDITAISDRLGIRPPFERLKTSINRAKSGMQQSVNISGSNGVSVIQTGNITGSDVFISGGDVIRRR